MAESSGRLSSAVEPVAVHYSGEVRIPPELLKAFAEESQGFHIKYGPGWVGIVAISPAFMQKLLANAKLVDTLQRNGMMPALEGQAMR